MPKLHSKLPKWTKSKGGRGKKGRPRVGRATTIGRSACRCSKAPLDTTLVFILRMLGSQ